MKKIVVLVIVLLTYNLYSAGKPILKETAFAEVSKQIGKGREVFRYVGILSLDESYALLEEA